MCLSDLDVLRKFSDDSGVRGDYFSKYKDSPYEKFFAEIKTIKRLNFTLFNDEEWYTDYNGSPNYSSMFQERT